MALISISNCPICNGTDFSIQTTCNDYTVSNESFSLEKCNTCHFVFTNPQPDKAVLSSYYQSDKYISHTGGNKTLIDWIYLQARKITLGRKRKIVEANSSANSILDIGCGTGEFLNEMKIHQWNVSGVEPSDTARPSAEKKIQIKIHKYLSEVENKKFNAISLWHVLEHLPDLNESLQQIAKVMSDSGTVFIAVPNLKSYDATHYQSYWAAYDVPRHLWHFDKETMKQVLEKNGFRLVKIQPMKLDSYYVSVLSESYKNPKSPRLINLIVGFLNGLKSNLLAIRTSEYSSLLYIAKR